MQRKRYAPEYRAKIVLEALREQRTLNELAQEYGPHPVQISQWKKQALDALPELFGNRKSAKAHAEEEATKARLFQQIGQLQVELDWLKNREGDIGVVVILDSGWFQRALPLEPVPTLFGGFPDFPVRDESHDRAAVIGHDDLLAVGSPDELAESLFGHADRIAHVTTVATIGYQVKVSSLQASRLTGPDGSAFGAVADQGPGGLGDLGQDDFAPGSA